MAIIYRKGDVLEALRKGEVDIVIHQTNCQGVMGSGIAKQIKSEFPEAYAAYIDQFFDNDGRLFLGDTSGAIISREGLKHGVIINVNGQDQYIDRMKCNTNYACLAKGLLACREWFESGDVVALPKIGAGLGGGDWRIIEALIESAFHDRTVYVYEFEAPKYSKRNDLA